MIGRGRGLFSLMDPDSLLVAITNSAKRYRNGFLTTEMGFGGSRIFGSNLSQIEICLFLNILILYLLKKDFYSKILISNNTCDTLVFICDAIGGQTSCLVLFRLFRSL